MKQLITFLSSFQPNEFVSGSYLSEKFKVSRSTVSSWVDELESMGLEVHRVKGKGYKLITQIQFIKQDGLIKKFSSEFKNAFTLIDIEGVVSSTNRTALDCQYNLGEWKLFNAEYQSNGRGRRGKEWLSPPCSNLLFSIGHKGFFNADVLYLSSLIVGVAIADVLSTAFKLNVSLKWPNDVYVSDKKISGILCELQGSPTDEATLVVGVGVNVLHAPNSIDRLATSLSIETGSLVNREEILAHLVESVVSYLKKANTEGVEKFLTKWRSYDFLKGKSVRVFRGERELNGIARGIDSKGQLIIEDRGGKLNYLNGGEVSVQW